eukprot:sb/3466877/
MSFAAYGQYAQYPAAYGHPAAGFNDRQAAQAQGFEESVLVPGILIPSSTPPLKGRHRVLVVTGDVSSSPTPHIGYRGIVKEHYVITKEGTAGEETQEHPQDLGVTLILCTGVMTSHHDITVVERIQFDIAQHIAHHFSRDPLPCVSFATPQDIIEVELGDSPPSEGYIQILLPDSSTLLLRRPTDTGCVTRFQRISEKIHSIVGDTTEGKTPCVLPGGGVTERICGELLASFQPSSHLMERYGVVDELTCRVVLGGLGRVFQSVSHLIIRNSDCEEDVVLDEGYSKLESWDNALSTAVLLCRVCVMVKPRPTPPMEGG